MYRAARHLYHIGNQLGEAREDHGSGWFAPTRRAWRFPRALNLIAQVLPKRTVPCLPLHVADRLDTEVLCRRHRHSLHSVGRLSDPCTHDSGDKYTSAQACGVIPSGQDTSTLLTSP